jgi:hypothetical protein
VEPILEHYKTLFWQPEAVRSIRDYGLWLLSLLPVCLAFWWILALALRSFVGDLRARLDTDASVRLIWARSALITGFALLADCCLIWHLTHLSGWTAITPHLTVAFFAGCFGLVVSLMLRSELSANRKKLFDALPKAAAAAGGQS